MRVLFSCQRTSIRLVIFALIFTPLLSYPSSVHGDDSTNQTIPNETIPRDVGATLYLPGMVTAPSQNLALGVYINPGASLEQFNQRIDQFETEVGKQHGIYQFYMSWSNGPWGDGYEQLLNIIIEHDATPMMSFMSIPARSDDWLGCGDPQWNLDSILSGSHDAYLHEFARGLTAWGHPILMRWGHEMNLDQLSWSGACNDGRTDKFIQAYRHIVDIFREEGAHNAKWIWSPVIGNHPPEEWNDYRNYYPGDDYVDWIGVVGYNFGASSPYSGYKWATFDMLYATMLRELAVEHPKKPVMLGDYGCVEDDGGDKAAWIMDAFERAKEHKNLRAMVWFNYAEDYGHDYAEEGDQWPLSFRIESSADSISAYRQAISDPYFLSSLP